MALTEYYNLDFDDIKAELKTFFESQDEFTDYNFSGSGLSSLLDVLAYATQYQAFVVNQSVNDLTLANAELDLQIKKLSNMLNYLPNRKSAPFISVDLQTDTFPIVIPAFSTWSLGSLVLSNVEAITLSDANTQTVNLYEGVPTTEYFVSDGTDFQEYELDYDSNIDNTYFEVYVDTPDGSGGYTEDTTPWINVNTGQFELQENSYYLKYFEKLIVKFDNGNLFSIPTLDQRVRVEYLYTNGTTYNNSSGTVLLTETGITNSEHLNIERTLNTVSLTLASSTGFTVGGDITGDSDNGNDGVGIITAISGNIVTTSITTGDFVVDNGVDNVNPYVSDETTITTIVENRDLLSSGTDEETNEEIKARAPLFYTTQNRGVTEDDYNIIVQKWSQYATLDSAVVWGGEKEFIDGSNQIIESPETTRDLGYIYVTALGSDLDYIDTIGTTTNWELLEAHLEKYKFLAIFFKFLDPTFITVKPTVNVEYQALVGVSVDIETTINTYLNTLQGFNNTFYLQELNAYIQELANVEYHTTTYTTSYTARHEDYKVVRLNGAIDANSIASPATINGFTLADDGAGNMTWNSGTVGSVNYTTGFIIIDSSLGGLAEGTAYEVDFDYADQNTFSLEKESYLMFEDIIYNLL